MNLDTLLRTARADHDFRALVRSSGLLYVAGIFSYGLTFLQQITTANLIGLNAYGQFATVVAATGLVMLIADFRTWEAASKFLAVPLATKDYQQASRIVGWLSAFDVVSGAIGASAVLLLSPLLAQYLLHDEATQVLIALYSFSLPFRLFAAGVPNAFLRLENRFGWLAAKSIVFSVARLILISGPAFMGLGLPGVLVGALAADAFHACVMAWLTFKLWHDLQVEQPVRRRLTLARPAELGRILDMLRTLWIGASLKALQLETFIPILALLTSPAQVGLLRFGLDVAQMVMRLSEPFSIVIQPTLIQLGETGDRKRFLRYIALAFCGLLLIAVPFFAGVVTLGPSILPLFIDPVYIPAIPVIQVLALGFAVSAAMLWLRPAIIALDCVRQQNTVGLFTLIVSVVSLILVAPAYGAIGAAVVMTGFLLFYNLLSSGIVIRHFSRNSVTV